MKMGELLASLYTRAGDYYEQLGAGKVADHSMVYKFGRMKTINGRIVPGWDVGGYYTFPTTAAIVDITSNHDDDAPAGAGAQKIHVFGKLAGFIEADEIVDVGSATVNAYLRVDRLYVEDAGTSEFPYDDTKIGNNVGTITATHRGTGLVIASIAPRLGQTLMAIFTIPKGYYGLLWAAKTGTGKGQDALGFLFVRDNRHDNPAWLVKGIRDMYQNTVGNEFIAPVKYHETSDIVLAVQGSASGTDVSCTFQLELVKMKEEESHA